MKKLFLVQFILCFGLFSKVEIKLVDRHHNSMRYYSCRNKDLIPNKTTYMNMAILPKREKGDKAIDEEVSWRSCHRLENTYLSVVTLNVFDYNPYAEDIIS